MAGTETHQIVSGQVYDVSYSADGRYLSYTLDAGGVGTLYVVDQPSRGRDLKARNSSRVRQ